MERTKNCANYFQVRIISYGFAKTDGNPFFQTIPTIAFEPTSDLEKEFPLAFSLALHHHVGIFEMFLALYWRPTDFYCIHVDIESHQKGTVLFLPFEALT